MAHRATQGHTPEATEGGVTDDAACEPAAPVDAPAGRETVSDWNIANALTMGRIALVPFFGWFLVARGGHVADLEADVAQLGPGRPEELRSRADGQVEPLGARLQRWQRRAQEESRHHD